MNTELTNIQKETNDILDVANNFNIISQEVYNSASIFLKSFMEVKKKIEDFFEPTINNFKKTKAEAEKGRKDEIEKMEQFLSPVNEAIGIVRGKCKDYENEQQRKAEEAQKKIAEAKRQELLKEAEEARKNAQHEKSDELEEKATKVEHENIDAGPGMIKSTKLGITRRWRWKIINEDMIPKIYWRLDEVMINREVMVHQENTAIPGISIYKE